MAEADRIVAEVAGAVGLVEGVGGVNAVVRALARLEPVSTRRLSRAAGLPVPIVASICGELRKRRVVAEQRPSQLTAGGRRLFARVRLDLPTEGAPALAPCVRDVARFARAAPRARVELDQCHCTVETKLRRVLALHDADALVGRRILVLGDDDLVSLALLSVVRRFGGRDAVGGLTVVDVDRDVVAFARRHLAGAPFSYACVEHDLRHPLPDSLVGAFDVVVTDPPYTRAGARLFLSRAASALTQDGTVLFSFGSRRLDTTAAVQRDLAAMGFAIQRLVPDFNAYEGAGVLAGTSNLYVLRATAELRPLVPGGFAGPLYTAQTNR